MTNFKQTTLGLLVVVFVLSGCTKDVKDELVSDVRCANELVGTYEGEVFSALLGKRAISVRVEAVADNTIKLTFLGNNIPKELQGSSTTDLYRVGDNEVWGKTPLITNILYYKKEKNLTYQKPGVFSFQGSR